MTAPGDEILHSDDVKCFVKVAERFCEVVERLAALSKLEFLQEMDELLPLVYSSASGLPSYPWDDAARDEGHGTRQTPSLMKSPAARGHVAKWKPLYNQIANKLGRHERYSLVFDPVDLANREVIDGSLADDLAGIYMELKDGLDLYRRDVDEAVRQAIWDWGFGRKIHWGRHAVHAMSTIYSLVHQHYDEDDEVFDL